MKKHPKKLTPFKAITGILAAIAIIVICIFNIIKKYKLNNPVFWQEIILILVAILFIVLIISAYYKSNKIDD